MSTSQRPQSEQWLDAMAKNREVTAYVILALGVGIWVALLILGLRYKSEIAAEIFVFGLVAPAFLGCGIFSLIRKEGTGSLSPRDAARLMVLILGASVGFAVFVEAFVRAIIWWDFMTGGLEKWQTAEAWRVWLVLFGAPFGLAIMFVTLLLARTEEQSDPFMRRVLYGYNAIVSSLLLLMILTVINILAYLYIPKRSDWTASGLYTLSSASENTLKFLEKPVKVYVLTDTRDDDLYNEIEALLENCHALSDKFTSEVVLRDKEPGRVVALARRYQLANTKGLLVVSGSEANELHQFIPLNDLIEYPRPSMDPSERDKPPKFKGEDALISAIRFLDEGKAEPVIYFTQGNGELDVSDSMQMELPPAQRARIMRDRLEKANYKIKGLRLSRVGAGQGDNPRLVTAKEVPDDATVVVVARPQTTLPAEVVSALRDYMSPKDPKKKKGMLVVLLNFDVGTDGKMLRTGLEGLLSEFSIEVTDDRILGFKEEPDALNVFANPQITDRNPVAAAFWRDRVAIPMRGIRAIKPSQGGGPRGGGGRYQAELLLATYNDRVWQESKLGDASKILNDWVENHPEELGKKLRVGLPVALAVSESQLPADPAHAGLRGMGDEKPRMVVFGNATWASDSALGRVSQGPGSQVLYSLMASSLAWLRERPGGIGIDAREPQMYTMSNQTNIPRLILYPASIMFIGIFGVGIGVWAVRRR
jgi:hypothetical protein